MSEKIKEGDIVIWNDNQILGGFEHGKEYRVVRAYKNLTGKYLNVEDIVSGLIYEGWYACRFKKVESKEEPKFDWLVWDTRNSVSPIAQFSAQTLEYVQQKVKENMDKTPEWKTAIIWKKESIINKTNQYEIKNV